MHSGGRKSCLATIKVAKEVIGIQPGYNHFGTMHIINSKKGVFSNNLTVEEVNFLHCGE